MKRADILKAVMLAAPLIGGGAAGATMLPEPGSRAAQFRGLLIADSASGPPTDLTSSQSGGVTSSTASGTGSGGTTSASPAGTKPQTVPAANGRPPGQVPPLTKSDKDSQKPSPGSQVIYVTVPAPEPPPPGVTYVPPNLTVVPHQMPAKPEGKTDGSDAEKDGDTGEPDYTNCGPEAEDHIDRDTSAKLNQRAERALEMARHAKPSATSWKAQVLYDGHVYLVEGEPNGYSIVPTCIPPEKAETEENQTAPQDKPDEPGAS